MAHLKIDKISLILITSFIGVSQCYALDVKASYSKPLPVERWFAGTVEAVYQSTVSAQTSGRIEDVRFDIGDNVSAGAVIVTIVSNEQRLALSQAEAHLAESQANLDSVSKNFERIDSLYNQRLVSKSEWDQNKAQLNVSKAQESAAEAAVKTAKEQLNYTEVKAPFGGTVSARLIEPGETVQPGTPLMTGFDPTAMRIKVSLPQGVAQQVKTFGQAVYEDDAHHRGVPEKLLLSPSADPSTSTIEARLELSHDNTLLYPGEFVRVGFTIGNIERLLIPVSSVVYRSEVTGVYVVKDNKPSLRQVRLGNIFGDEIEVLAGIKVGEQIATDPLSADRILHQNA